MSQCHCTSAFRHTQVNEEGISHSEQEIAKGKGYSRKDEVRGSVPFPCRLDFSKLAHLVDYAQD